MAPTKAARKIKRLKCKMIQRNAQHNVALPYDKKVDDYLYLKKLPSNDKLAEDLEDAIEDIADATKKQAQDTIEKMAQAHKQPHNQTTVDMRSEEHTLQQGIPKQLNKFQQIPEEAETIAEFMDSIRAYLDLMEEIKSRIQEIETMFKAAEQQHNADYQRLIQILKTAKEDMSTFNKTVL